MIESEDAAASSVSFNILNWVISQQYSSINPGDNINMTVKFILSITVVDAQIFSELGFGL